MDFGQSDSPIVQTLSSSQSGSPPALGRAKGLGGGGGGRIVFFFFAKVAFPSDSNLVGEDSRKVT